VGVAPRGFTGTEPGTATDIFVPTMMHDGVTHSDWSTFRILAQVTPGTAVEPLRNALRGPYRAFNEERAKTFTGLPPQFIERFFRQTLLLEPAAAGVSNMQTEYRTALAVLGALVALVLIIACVNVANLLTGQAAARAREMALRVSIGAGRSRLVQLVLVESLLLAALAALVGGLFAWWSAPFVVSMINPPDNPARLFLPADWRVLAFGLTIASIVTCVFGLGPALRASSVKPSTALKRTDGPRGRNRLMHGLIVVQVAFCVLVLFVSGLFVNTFDRLSRQSTGFSSERLLTIDTAAASPQSPTTWEQVTNRLRDTPGVETAALAGFS
jgi:cell division protein FtsX